MKKENLTSRIEKHILRIGNSKGCNERQINTIIAMIRTIREEGGIKETELEKIFDLVGSDIDD
jgi:hypothetical protein